jgi:hypothetical protein
MLRENTFLPQQAKSQTGRKHRVMRKNKSKTAMEGTKSEGFTWANCLSMSMQLEKDASAGEWITGIIGCINK